MTCDSAVGHVRGRRRNMEMLMVIGQMTVDGAVWGDNIRRSQQQEVGGRKER